MADGKVVIDTELDQSGLDKGLTSAEKKMTKSGGRMGNGIMKAAAVGITAVATSVGVLAGKSVTLYADYEQLTGGIEKLFKGAYAEVLKDAKNAFKESGLSANQYMQTVTSFSATLIAGLGGDTSKAAKIAKTAIKDMSDNANTFGTDITSIQNAYQGFAKGNFTMLDNLRIGFGGTQAEMARLINQSGVLGKETKVNAETVKDVPFDKIIEAIHTIQTEMGITGTTAKEASKTIEGSANAMKAAWANLLTKLASGESVEEEANALFESVKTFAKNVTPAIKNALKGIGTFAGKLIESLPEIINAGFQFVSKFASSISASLPTLIPTIVQLLIDIGSTIVKNLPLLLNAGLKIVVGLAKGLINALPQLIAAIPKLITGLVNGIVTFIPQIAQAGITLITSLVEKLPDIISEIVKALPQIITAVTKFFTEAIPTLILAGFDLFVSLISNLPEIIKTIVKALPKIVKGIVEATVESYARISKAGKELFEKLIEKRVEISAKIKKMAKDLISSVIGKIKEKFKEMATVGKDLFFKLVSKSKEIINKIKAIIPEIIKGIKEKVTEKISDMKNIGKNLLEGLWNGMSNAKTWLISKIKGLCSDATQAIKDFFKIKSPSRLMADEVGKYIAQGIGVGFVENDPMKQIKNDLQLGLNSLRSAVRLDMNTNISGIQDSQGITQYITIEREVNSPDEIARAIRMESKFGLMGGYI